MKQIAPDALLCMPRAAVFPFNLQITSDSVANEAAQYCSCNDHKNANHKFWTNKLNCEILLGMRSFSVTLLATSDSGQGFHAAVSSDCYHFIYHVAVGKGHDKPTVMESEEECSEYCLATVNIGERQSDELT